MPVFHRLTLFALLTLGIATGVNAGEITIFAAASTKTALDDVATAFHDATGNTMVLSYAGSSTLARQIELGAPADIFLSANIAWMDRLDAKGAIRPETRHDLLGNSLVLIATAPGPAPVTITKGFDLPKLVGSARIAMALVNAVPAGIYGKAALQWLGVWDALSPQVVQTDNVRAALALVALGEAPFGITYATDAVAEPRVTAIATFPPESHAPIIYPVAATATRTNPLTASALAFLTSPAARRAFKRQGFTVLPKSKTQ
ncbi:molybdate ABC transporter substrate-binding protein [Aquicoccus sp. G2-2]|uniref:molybdate ABC transporter substrate-binding protein n=1 Tax=Aquicoccus sp. G2-2 TaxID=3092120 RepID=UPI002AE01229|nr:molybdate ABC transporter substrate-binding protein [Aquicoccus sp. G2-2]MEA1115092.1 molybdate ABC transporter substrate-binding protein [Aquicoccus sp. G2-2]